MKYRKVQLIAGIVLAVVAGGCTQGTYSFKEKVALRERAVECLRLGVRFEHLASVRAQAIEAMQETCGVDELPRLRLTLSDEVPGVRFAGAVALGTLRDALAEPSFRRMLDSDVASDRLAAIFAMHRLGHVEHTAEMAYWLLDSEDMGARCNAAMLLGRLGEPGAMKLLSRAMRDPDRGLRANVLEGLALLGSDEAVATLYAQAYSGIGEEETFALMVLGQLRDPIYRDLLRAKLKDSSHLETRLAAARALGLLGDDSGLSVALRALTFAERRGTKGDPARNRTLRVRQMAALALGAIGDERVLGPLEKLMESDGDPRWQVAAAKAILEITAPTEAMLGARTGNSNSTGRRRR